MIGQQPLSSTAWLWQFQADSDHDRACTICRGAISYSWLSAMLILGCLLGLFVLRRFGLTLRQQALLKMSEGALLKQVCFVPAHEQYVPSNGSKQHATVQLGVQSSSLGQWQSIVLSCVIHPSYTSVAFPVSKILCMCCKLLPRIQKLFADVNVIWRCTAQLRLCPC